MPKKKRAEDITWFNISNYKVLADLTVGEFCRELSNRIFLWDTQEKGNEKDLLVFFIPWLAVLNGEIELDYRIPCGIDTLGLTDPDNLFFSAEKSNLGVKLVTQKLLDGIHEYSHKPQYLISITDINKIKNVLCENCSHNLMEKSKGHIEDIIHLNAAIFCFPCLEKIITEHQIEMHGYSTNVISSTSVNKFIDLNHYLNKKGNLLSIDLETYSDEELVNQLRSELPKFRALLNTPEPTIKYQKKTTNNHLRQMIKSSFTYQVIPVLDLKLLQFLPEIYSSNITTQNKTVTHEQILNLVFKDDEKRDRDWMKKTLQKMYIDPLLEKGVINKILTYVQKDPFLCGQLMSEFMKK